MSFAGFAFLTEIKVWTDTALVSDPLDRAHTAAVADNALMDLHCLFLSFLANVVSNHSLEGLGGE
jgi:hypothetical protein